MEAGVRRSRRGAFYLHTNVNTIRERIGPALAAGSFRVAKKQGELWVSPCFQRRPPDAAAVLLGQLFI